MTRIDRSPEILDAMAANRREGHQRIATAALHRHSLIQWQASAWHEAPIRTASSYPPEGSEEVDGVHVRIIDPGARVGFTLTESMLGYLDGTGGHRYPLHDALLAWDRVCRRRHDRWPDHRGRPVCAELAWMVFRDRTSLTFAADQVGISFPRAERLLGEVARFVRDKQKRWLEQTEMSATHDQETCRVCSPLPKSA